MAQQNTSTDAVDQILEQWARELPDIDAGPLAVFGRIHRVYLRYQAHASALLAEHGITPASFDILAALRRSGVPYRQTAGALADSCLVTSGGTSLRIDRLEQAGLVRRERDDDDRRVVYVVLTEAGLAMVEVVAARHFAQEDALLGGLSPARRRELADLLGHLEHSIDAFDAARPEGTGAGRNRSPASVDRADGPSSG